MIAKLKDVCEFIVDCPHTTAQDEGQGYPLIRTPNIGKGRFDLDGVHRVSEDIYKKRNLRATPQDNGLSLNHKKTKIEALPAAMTEQWVRKLQKQILPF